MGDPLLPPAPTTKTALSQLPLPARLAGPPQRPEGERDGTVLSPHPPPGPPMRQPPGRNTHSKGKLIMPKVSLDATFCLLACCEEGKKRPTGIDTSITGFTRKPDPARQNLLSTL